MGKVKEQFIRRLPLGQRERARDQAVGLSDRLNEGERAFIKRLPREQREAAEQQAILTREERLGILRRQILRTGTIGDESTVEAPHPETGFGDRLSPHESVTAGITGAGMAVTETAGAAADAANAAANARWKAILGRVGIVVAIVGAFLLAIRAVASGFGRGLAD